MQKVVLHVATRGRLLCQITVSQRVDGALWPCHRHPDSGPKMVVFTAFPALIKIIATFILTVYFIYFVQQFLVIQMHFSPHHSAAESVWVSCLISGNLLLWWSPTLTGRHPQRCKQQQHPPAAEPRSYKRPFQSVHFSFPLNNCTCAAQNTRPSQGLLTFPHCRRRPRRRRRRRRCPFVTCDSVPDHFEERTESKMPLSDCNIEGCVTALRKRATRGWRSPALNAGSCFFYHLATARGSKWE